MPIAGISDDLARKAVNTIRLLAADAVQKANSGHPGLPMGAADYAFILWGRYLRYNPDDPQWLNRDRFVLSAGHGSALLYSLLHLAGFDLAMEDLQDFRQWESRTPGHPEYWCAPGVETTTGPLGQGFGNAVGMALAQKHLAARFDRDGFPLLNHHVYAICSDGDLMEGVASEAASLAGHLKLGSIVFFYDDNHITIEGDTDLTYSEDVGRRFEAYGWHLQHVDGHDHDEIMQAIEAARAETDRPSLIICRTHIAYGSPTMQDTAESHGAPLGEDELRATKQALGFPPDESFVIPDDVRALFAQRREELKQDYDAWQQLLADYRAQHPDLADLWDATFQKRVPDDIMDRLLEIEFPKPDATRNSSGQALQVAASLVPSLIGGSADLAPSTKTLLKGEDDFAADCPTGRNLRFGIREHAMGAICSGMALYGGLIPYGATFLVFSDYMRPSIRLAAMSGLHVIYVFTHDSVFVGEDGPTHQPIEHIAALRAIPNLTVIRPADPTETAAAWAAALQHTDGPVALVLTRQSVPVIDRTQYPSAANLARGAYVLRDSDGEPDLILIGTGSEVSLALEVGEKLAEQGHKARVVSMPSWDLFAAQPQEYQGQVLPPTVKRRVTIEAAATFGWHRYAGVEGLAIGIDRFGASAPYKVIADKLGFTAQAIVERIRSAFSL